MMMPARTFLLTRMPYTCVYRGMSCRSFEPSKAQRYRDLRCNSDLWDNLLNRVLRRPVQRFSAMRPSSTRRCVRRSQDVLLRCWRRYSFFHRPCSRERRVQHRIRLAIRIGSCARNLEDDIKVISLHIISLSHTHNMMMSTNILKFLDQLFILRMMISCSRVYYQ